MTLEGDVLGTSWEPIFAGWVDDFKIVEKYGDYGRKKDFVLTKQLDLSILISWILENLIVKKVQYFQLIFKTMSIV